ncbi:MAG: FKBP-type peptidyl-prolyl cis-trans isomerase [Muribaculaceae bacterium]|nr:FKBP-type peptidyl-prolyl cis-trans isomerase [Muribaculaceae bacterium]
MKKFLTYIFLPLMMAVTVTACNSGDDDDSATTWDKYADYRAANIEWMNQLEQKRNPDGTPYYERLVPQWNLNSYILIHWFNDRSETAGNLTPLLTSSVRARYIGRNYLGEIFDADSTSENGTFFMVNQVVSGWQLALQNMHVGDTVEIILPYNQAYGSTTPNTLIPPYSALSFTMRLHDIPTLEVRP